MVSQLLLERCATCNKYEDDCACDAIALTPTQMAFIESNKRFIVVVGGRGSGKSYSSTLKMKTMIESGAILPGARILVLAPTYPQLKKGTLQTFDKILGDLILEKVDGNEPERRMVNGIIAYFRNASNPDQTRSHEVQVVWLDEAAQMESNVLTLSNAALRQFGNDADYYTLVTTTPRGQNWLYRAFVDPSTKLFSDDKVDYFKTSTIEAWEYGIVRDDYIEELGYIPGSDMWKQEVLAEFVTWAGLVFNRYDPAVHSAPERFNPLPEFQTVYAGVDVGYGGRGFTSMHVNGVTPQGAIYTFAEYHEKRADTHAWMYRAGELTKERKVNCWYIDEAADQELRAMRAAGFRVKPSIKVKDAAGVAVNFINSKFQRNELFIDRVACPFLCAEIEAYRFKEIMDGDETTFLMKVVPNQHDDAIDSWRYGVYPLASAAAQRSYGQSVPFSFGGR